MKLWEIARDNIKSREGRPPTFETPQQLWEAAVKYFKWAEDNKMMIVDARGKDANIVHIPAERPFTLHALCIHMGVNSAWWRQFKVSETVEKVPEFSTVITHIEDIIYNQKFEGATIGTYNANIISRDLGLTDKKETEVTGGKRPIVIEKHYDKPKKETK